jgi:hypothetical protein
VLHKLFALHLLFVAVAVPAVANINTMVRRRSRLVLLLLLLLQSALMIARAFTIGGNHHHRQKTNTGAAAAARRSAGSSSRSCLFADSTIVAAAKESPATAVGVVAPAVDDGLLSLGSTTEHCENYDIVKVDLDDGRDYPIYIGTGYSDAQGE